MINLGTFSPSCNEFNAVTKWFIFVLPFVCLFHFKETACSVCCHGLSEQDLSRSKSRFISGLLISLSFGETLLSLCESRKGAQCSQNAAAASVLKHKDRAALNPRYLQPTTSCFSSSEVADKTPIVPIKHAPEHLCDQRTGVQGRYDLQHTLFTYSERTQWRSPVMLSFSVWWQISARPASFHICSFRASVKMAVHFFFLEIIKQNVSGKKNLIKFQRGKMFK